MGEADLAGRVRLTFVGTGSLLRGFAAILFASVSVRTVIVFVLLMGKVKQRNYIACPRSLK